ncbi:uncharacterized protein MEPE_04097 [Melanopsichium pennsylvanicum]|uniref:Transmembrane protein n=2 Tax=Melanopsichium pennsylvanicum TaxID=63383 RepID=A0AAJ4XQT7_9BASI|nr:uncharacterized protein BN887_02905 [Melanopsichium pennsylvanicum 4]SNX85388.1 uncharacterized protein MEPE_04097 [Melanopsichium pennsylvanicum]
MRFIYFFAASYILIAAAACQPLREAKAELEVSKNAYQKPSRSPNRAKFANGKVKRRFTAGVDAATVAITGLFSRFGHRAGGAETAAEAALDDAGGRREAFSLLNRLKSRPFGSSGKPWLASEPEPHTPAHPKPFKFVGEDGGYKGDTDGGSPFFKNYKRPPLSSSQLAPEIGSPHSKINPATDAKRIEYEHFWQDPSQRSKMLIASAVSATLSLLLARTIRQDMETTQNLDAARTSAEAANQAAVQQALDDNAAREAARSKNSFRRRDIAFTGDDQQVSNVRATSFAPAHSKHDAQLEKHLQPSGKKPPQKQDPEQVSLQSKSFSKRADVEPADSFMIYHSEDVPMLSDNARKWIIQALTGTLMLGVLGTAAYFAISELGRRGMKGLAGQEYATPVFRSELEKATSTTATQASKVGDRVWIGTKVTVATAAISLLLWLSNSTLKGAQGWEGLAKNGQRMLSSERPALRMQYLDKRHLLSPPAIHPVDGNHFEEAQTILTRPVQILPHEIGIPFYDLMGLTIVGAAVIVPAYWFLEMWKDALRQQRLHRQIVPTQRNAKRALPAASELEGAEHILTEPWMTERRKKLLKILAGVGTVGLIETLVIYDTEEKMRGKDGLRKRSTENPTQRMQHIVVCTLSAPAEHEEAGLTLARPCTPEQKKLLLNISDSVAIDVLTKKAEHPEARSPGPNKELHRPLKRSNDELMLVLGEAAGSFIGNVISLSPKAAVTTLALGAAGGGSYGIYYAVKKKQKAKKRPKYPTNQSLHKRYNETLTEPLMNFSKRDTLTMAKAACALTQNPIEEAKTTSLLGENSVKKSRSVDKTSQLSNRMTNSGPMATAIVSKAKKVVGELSDSYKLVHADFRSLVSKTPLRPLEKQARNERLKDYAILGGALAALETMRVYAVYYVLKNHKENKQHQRELEQWHQQKKQWEEGSSNPSMTSERTLAKRAITMPLPEKGPAEVDLSAHVSKVDSKPELIKRGEDSPNGAVVLRILRQLGFGAHQAGFGFFPSTPPHQSWSGSHLQPHRQRCQRRPSSSSPLAGNFAADSPKNPFWRDSEKDNVRSPSHLGQRLHTYCSVEDTGGKGALTVGRDSTEHPADRLTKRSE